MDKNQANSQLRYAIAVLRGKHGWNTPHNQINRVLLALSIRNQFKRDGFWWQARKLSIWIGKFFNSEFLPERASASEGLRASERASEQLLNLHGVDVDE